MSGGDWSDIARDELERRHREACELLLAAQEELSRLAEALASAIREIELARAAADAARGERDESERARTLRDQQLAGVLDSASWRLTRPLRVLKARVREPGT